MTNKYLRSVTSDQMFLVIQMDRTYLRSPTVVAVLDHERKRTYVIGKEGLPDTGKNHTTSRFDYLFVYGMIHYL